MQVTLKLQVEVTSLMIQWLRLHASTTGSAGFILSLGTKIPYAEWPRIKSQVEIFVYLVFMYYHIVD